MTTEPESANHVEERNPGWVTFAIVILCILALTGLTMAWKALNSAQDSRQKLASDMQAAQQASDTKLNAIAERLAANDKAYTNLQDDLSVVVKRLQITQGELKKAREEAQEIRAEGSQQISEMDSEMKGQLATKASNDDVKSVSGEVGVVRSDLDTTKKDLQMARSEMGTLIARNHDQIETLRQLGERDYVEFAIAGKNKVQNVRGIAIELRGTDPKKNQCNLALVVDEKRTENRNRSVNQPIFVYMHGAHQPTEIVINKVQKNSVAGYVSMPKVSEPAATVSAGR
jgi:hypothetical protein